MRPSEVWCLDMDPDEKLLVLALLDYGPLAFPKQATLARKTGLARRTVQRIVKRLSSEGGTSPIAIRVERRSRGLVYRVVMRQRDADESVSVTPMMRQPDAPRCVSVTPPSKLVQGTSPPNPETATAVGGWEVPSEVVQAIRVRDPRATPEAHGTVCRRILAQYGIEGRDAVECFRTLCLAWAKTGNNAYEILAGHTESLEGARDVRAVLLARIRREMR
jgi:hypothetical protein